MENGCDFSCAAGELLVLQDYRYVKRGMWGDRGGLTQTDVFR